MTAIRPAGPHDVPAIRAIASAHNTLDAWPERPDYLDHELATGTVLVAVEGRQMTAFGAAVERDGVHHLGDLFVLPGLEGRGAGTALLHELLPDSGPRTTFSSSDRRALALYARRGLVPVAPLLHLRGTAGRVEWAAAGMAGGDHAAAARIDADVRGYARVVDHRFLAELGGVELQLFERSFAYLRTTGDTTRVGPCGDLDGGSDSVLAAVARAAGRSPTVELALPGPHPALRPLLYAGYRIVDVDTIMTSPADLVDWSRVVPDPDLG